MNKDKVILGIRTALWIILAGIAPIAFIMWRYELFSKVTKIQVGGWGIIAIIILAIFTMVLSKYIKKILSIKWTMTSQVLSGLFKVILPILAIYVILYCIKDNINNFMQSILATLICETIAIPVNPMPKLIYDLSKGETQDLIEYALRDKKEDK